jgi:hypothetical protein
MKKRRGEETREEKVSKRWRSREVGEGKGRRESKKIIHSLRNKCPTSLS